MFKTNGSVLLLICSILLACNAAKVPSQKNEGATIINESRAPIQFIDSLVHGIPVYSSTTLNYKRSGKSLLNIELKAPVVVSVASKPEKWGFFQFPTIERKLDNSVGVKWNLNADAIEAYGNHKFGAAVSKDGGLTWQPSTVPHVSSPLTLSNGDRIAVHTPKPIPVSELALPKLIGRGQDTYARLPYDLYKLHDLPESRHGVFLDRLNKGDTEWKTVKASLYDPQAARYSLKGLFPVLFWGDMHIAPDKSIIAGIYPGFFIREDGTTDPKTGAFFYRSVDQAHSWKIQGRVTYIPNVAVDPKANNRIGFTEPAYEILSDGTFICVLRTTDGIGNGPMYISRSSDLGVTWTKPEILTASGVLPRLLQLKNGVTVLSSGRPGVQLRFSNDGKGQVWTDAFEMMPYKGYRDEVSCGYTGLVATGADRFIVVYSDFKHLNQSNELRKAIKVREVVVTPK